MKKNFRLIENLRVREGRTSYLDCLGYLSADWINYVLDTSNHVLSLLNARLVGNSNNICRIIGKLCKSHFVMLSIYHKRDPSLGENFLRMRLRN